MTITAPIFEGATIIFSVFGDWFINFFEIIHFLIYLFVIFQFFGFPCYRIGSQALVCGFCIATALSDLIMLAFDFIDVYWFIPFITAIVFLVIASIVMYVIFKKLEKVSCFYLNDAATNQNLNISIHHTFSPTQTLTQTNQNSGASGTSQSPQTNQSESNNQNANLNPIKLSSMTEEEKVAYLTDLGLGRSVSKALKFLQIGVINGCDFLLDMSLIRFLVMAHDSPDILMKSIQILVRFPGELRYLNSLFNNAIKRRTLTFGDRFLIYQVYKIKTLRASSASTEANEKLTDLRNKGKIIEKKLRSFWNSKKCFSAFFSEISRENKSLNALWQEAIRDFPNSAKFSEEYSRFLVEDMTDFDAALIQKQRAEMIDVGVNFSTDSSFRCFVRAYPEYLKRKLVDVSGTILQAKRKRGGSSSNSTGTGRHSTGSTNSIEIDAELENTLGKIILKDHKMRLALHRSLNDKTTSAIVGMHVSAVIILIFGLAAFAGIFSFLQVKFSDRASSMARLNFVSEIRFNLGLASLEHIFDYGDAHSLFGDGTYLKYSLEDDQTIVDPATVFLAKEGFKAMNLTMLYQSYSRDALSSLIENIGEMANNEINVYTFTGDLLYDNLVATICVESPPNVLAKLPQYKTNLKNLIVLNYFLQSCLSGAFNTYGQSSSLLTRVDYCEEYNNWKSIISGCDHLFNQFLEYQAQTAQGTESLQLVLFILVPVLLVLGCCVPQLVCVILFSKQTTVLGDTMLELDSSVKAECQQPLKQSTVENDTETQELKKSTSSITVFSILLFILTLVMVGVSLGMLFVIQDGNAQILQLNKWENFAAQRISMCAEILDDTLSLLLVVDPSLDGTKATFLDSKTLKNTIDTEIESLTKDNEDYLAGSQNSEPCHGYDDELDNLNLKAACNQPEGKDPLHNLYKCVSTNQMLTIFLNFASDLITRPQDYHYRFDSPKALHIVHLSGHHLYHRLLLTLNRIVELGNVTFSRLVADTLIFAVIGIALTIFCTAVAVSLGREMRMTLKGCYVLAKHIPPRSLVNSKRLMAILLEEGSGNKESGISLGQAIIRKSQDGIICTNSSAIVDMCNPANTAILGYTPEQLLGQPIFSFFTPDMASSLQTQLDLIKSGQSSEFYEGHTQCLTDRETVVPCYITVLGMKNKANVVESFAVILRDESLLLQHQKEAEEAKAQSENLLFQILPRDIVVKLNRGETDISFVVPSASIIFVDIVRFSDYAATLTPEQIMGNLSTIFAAFDTLITKYPLLYKIKLIGDVYMAAGGLFSQQDENPSNHAEQTIKFGLDVIQELEDLNMKLNASLAVRVGINSGGPIIAGVLGTDKPVFDIIGDPINVASRLQSTDVPGRIQISQAVYDLISAQNFEIESRGEVFLKGKGKTTAYFVRPFSFMSQLSSHGEGIALTNPSTLVLPTLAE